MAHTLGSAVVGRYLHSLGSTEIVAFDHDSPIEWSCFRSWRTSFGSSVSFSEQFARPLYGDWNINTLSLTLRCMIIEHVSCDEGGDQCVGSLSFSTTSEDGAASSKRDKSKPTLQNNRLVRLLRAHLRQHSGLSGCPSRLRARDVSNCPTKSRTWTFCMDRHQRCPKTNLAISSEGGISEITV